MLNVPQHYNHTHTFSLCWRDIFIPFHHIIIIRFAYRYAQLSIIACLTGVLFRFFVHTYIPCASSISFPFLVLICRSLTPHRCALAAWQKIYSRRKRFSSVRTEPGPPGPSQCQTHPPTVAPQLEQRRERERKKKRKSTPGKRNPYK